MSQTGAKLAKDFPQSAHAHPHFRGLISNLVVRFSGALDRGTGPRPCGNPLMGLPVRHPTQFPDLSQSTVILAAHPR